MEFSRRNFLEGSSLLSLLMGTQAYGLAAGTQTPSETFDASTFSFWTDKIRETTDNLKKGVYTAGPVQTPGFVYFDDKSGKFHVGTDVPDDDLPQDGDAKISVRVEHFRPSSDDAAQFQNSQTGTLRLDVGQINSAYPGVTEALAWTAIAAFVPKAGGQLPSLDKLSFDPGASWNSPQSIPVPGGAGYWSWNLFVKKPQHLWAKILDLFVKGANAGVLSVLGLPAIALTALKSLDKVLGYVQSADSSIWVLQSQNTPFYSTKNGKKQAGDNGICLRTGTYLVMPQSHLGRFGKAQAQEDLVIQKGSYLVPRKTSEFGRVDAAQTAAADVTYFAVSVNSEFPPNNPKSTK
jgi:hypothetical protein